MLEAMKSNPPTCSPLLKNVVLSCVKYDPQQRPSFDDIRVVFDVVEPSLLFG